MQNAVIRLLDMIVFDITFIGKIIMIVAQPFQSILRPLNAFYCLIVGVSVTNS